MDTYAPPKLRWEWRMNPRDDLAPGDRDVGFRQYLAEFVQLATDLRDRRSKWKEIAPADDPMHLDETQFRILDAELITSLESLGAKDNELRLVHALPARLDSKPGTQGVLQKVGGGDVRLRAKAESVPGVEDHRALLGHHSAVLRQLKTYTRACDQMKNCLLYTSPSPRDS